MVYDSLNQRILLFGGLGNDYTDSYNDTWVYDSESGNWTELLNSDNSEISTTQTSTSPVSTTQTSTTPTEPIPGFELLFVTIVIVSLSFIKLRKNLEA